MIFLFLDTPNKSGYDPRDKADASEGTNKGGEITNVWDQSGTVMVLT
jgi:hypothetical protein